MLRSCLPCLTLLIVSAVTSNFPALNFVSTIPPPLPPLSLVQMMLAHSKAGLYEESLDYWRQLVCVDGIGEVKIHIETYHCALKSAVAVCQWDEVEAILDMMKVQKAFSLAPVCRSVGRSVGRSVDRPLSRLNNRSVGLSLSRLLSRLKNRLVGRSVAQ